MIRTLRQVLRSLIRTKTLSLVAIGTLAIGIAAVTVIFSVANALFLQPLPHIVEQDQLFVVHQENAASWPNYLSIRDSASESFTGVAAFTSRLVSLRSRGEGRLALAAVTSANYFDVLGVRPSMGRFFRESEELPEGAHPIVVLSHRVWVEDFGRSTDVIDQSIRLNGQPMTVIGVAPEGFIGTFIGFEVEVWTTYSMMPAVVPNNTLQDRGEDSLVEIFARKRSDLSLSQVEARLDSLARAMRAEFPFENREYEIRVAPMTGIDDEIRKPAMGLVLLLLLVSGLVLAAACANVSNMLLARSAFQSRVNAIRLALGASRLRVAGLVLLESLLLSLAASGIALLISIWTVGLLRGFEPPLPVAITFDFRIDAVVFSIATLLGLTAGAVAGLLPSIQGSRLNLLSILNDRYGSGRTRSRWRTLLVIAQVAVSVMLLIIAGLFIRTIRNAATTDAGFETENAYVAPFIDLSLLDAGPDRIREFYRSLVDQIEATPEVESAAVTAAVPLGLTRGSEETVTGPGIAGPEGSEQRVRVVVIGPGFLEALRIPTMSGREIDRRDGVDSPPVVMVSESAAARLWNRSDVVGRRLTVRGGEAEVIGVAGNVTMGSLRSAGEPVLYLPLAQHPMSRMNLIIRTSGAEFPLEAALRSLIRNLEPDLPIPQLQSLRSHLGISLLAQRIGSGVSMVLALVALLLASGGLYGIASFSVEQRRGEISVRMALGASRRAIARLVLGGGMRAVAVGLVAGVLLGAGLASLASSFLHGVSPLDPLTITTVVVLIGVTGVVSIALPALKAARIEPATILKG